ncbi:hypothetical protein C8J55DRAFT_506379 [Lentinula edodes]|uniref:Uncharacterized protein n=1 Tax=Lentinula lateritia TaxID=40482 RepID=A0A9W9AT75_9AGAR|nr:hypothetical protein C8J55DRAFT_506379 [Lentinula edodes]
MRFVSSCLVALILGLFAVVHATPVNVYSQTTPTSHALPPARTPTVTRSIFLTITYTNGAGDMVDPKVDTNAKKMLEGYFKQQYPGQNIVCHITNSYDKEEGSIQFHAKAEGLLNGKTIADADFDGWVASKLVKGKYVGADKLSRTN